MTHARSLSILNQDRGIFIGHHWCNEEEDTCARDGELITDTVYNHR